MTGRDERVREVPIGTEVIYADQAGVFRYDGTTTGPFAEIAFSLRGDMHGLRCQAVDVAPKDTPIPASDARVMAAKQARGHYPTYKGPWLLVVADASRGQFFKTKRDAVAQGLRTVAIADWHSAQ